MALIRAIMIVLLLSGCALQEQRKLLLAPEPLNSSATRAVFVDAYAKALAEAQASGTKPNVLAYVDSGNALNALNCAQWTDRLTQARRGLVASDRNIGVFAGLLTALFGIFGASADAVAVLGAGTAAAHGFGTGMQDTVLGAPSQYQAQAAILGLQQQCADQLLTDAQAGGMTFGRAYGRLEACARVCSADAATEAANHAIANTAIVVSPTGALRVQK